MNILLATSEAVPFAKTGGLADVSAALPLELSRLGHRPTVILPAYRRALECGQPIESTGIDVSVQIGSKTVDGLLLKSQLPDSDVPVYLVQQDDYFNRDELYGIDGSDYVDNCERFVFFCRAVLEAIRLLQLDVDVLHANDWQTGLLPAYLKVEYRTTPGYERIASLFTIHNLAYQGTFWHWDMLLTGLDWKYFNWHQMEFYGKLNLMKTGLVFADAINTVSPRYAEEIQRPPLGCGLEGVLQQRHDVLSGIINGVDYGTWDPAVDPQLAMNYDASSAAEGKAACKAALQSELGLPVLPRTPVIGLISRLADQKGLDLVAGVIQDWVRTTDVQWTILGSGDPKYQQLLGTLAERYPQRVAARLSFSDALAHRIEAGADMFLMPSRYEPCGLNQLYSLKYGTVPVVRATGGLADTIVDTSRETLADGTATGFSFREYEMLALSETLRRAVEAYNEPETWSQLVRSGMQQDWSWSRSARQYVDLYQSIAAQARTRPYSAAGLSH
ncbi:MAG TPA: glycogen synthase GlgA [Pirellulales bacterium]|jgi:starch synthase|nr:glycogen synthase GlgA [Pirellulales bacterium]